MADPWTPALARRVLLSALTVHGVLIALVGTLALSVDVIRPDVRIFVALWVLVSVLSPFLVWRRFRRHPLPPAG